MAFELEIKGGTPFPLGFYKTKEGANFAVFSAHASQVFLGIFLSDHEKEIPKTQIAMRKTGDIWHICVENLMPDAYYAFRCEGPKDESKGLLFSPKQWLADPYSKILDTPIRWGVKRGSYYSKAAAPPSFDWQGVEPPRIPREQLVIYEMHVRGFTQSLSSKAKAPGTFLGIIEKIPYLKRLGINAIELLPIYEFDETHCRNIHPKTGAALPNYWGYNPLFYFAPMRRFSMADDPLSPIFEFKTMVRELHRNQIEVWLDVVYNHTGEGKEKDYEVNFRGLDNSVYYMVDPAGRYRDYTGCGNTLNCNHPQVLKMVTDSLRYWVEEMRVDGFRFDLASTFTRDQNGHVLGNAPVIQAISQIHGVKLIAESWDAAGLYQVGQFPQWGPWSDWNGKYRDVVRKFLKGTNGYAGKFADALSGSQSIYGPTQTPLSGVNFITAHDGYSLQDLVSYQGKYNRDNGEENRDGSNQNNSWNCGIEGVSDNPEIQKLRERQIRNFFLALFLSQGMPMLLMGDEYGHTRRGNNNPYVQDNELNWFLWDELEKNEGRFSFVCALISFRKTYPQFCRSRFLSDLEVEWHGKDPGQADWSDSSRFIAYTLKGNPAFYVAFNAGYQPIRLTLPPGKQWRELVYTKRDWKEHNLLSVEKGPLLAFDIELDSYSAFLAICQK